MSKKTNHPDPVTIEFAPFRTDSPDWEAAERMRASFTEAYSKTPEEHFPDFPKETLSTKLVLGTDA